MLHFRNTDFVPARDPARRFDVSTGRPKRRIFTAAEKAKIVAESFESGRSVCAVARRHGLMAAQLFAWRRNARLRREEEALGAGRAQPLGLEFAALAAEPQPATQMTPIEIEIGATIVRVPQGFDAATLKAVLQALNAIA
jgi:transposase